MELGGPARCALWSFTLVVTFVVFNTDHLQKSLARVPLGYDTMYNGVAHCVEVGNLYGHPLAGKH